MDVGSVAAAVPDRSGRSPVVAGAAMALSSVSVVTNALLLKRWRPPRDTERLSPDADATAPGTRSRNHLPKEIR